MCNVPHSHIEYNTHKYRQMDDDSREQLSLELSSLPSGPSASRENEQVNGELQHLWSLYRKPTPSPDSDADSDASEASSDGSVQWEKNFIGKLVKVKKHSPRQERTGSANEDLEGCPEKQEGVLFCESKSDSNCDNHQPQESEELTPNLNQDETRSPEKSELPLLHEKSPHCGPSNSHPRDGSLPQTSSHPGEYSNCQPMSSEEAEPELNEVIMGSPSNSQVSSTSDFLEDYCLSCSHEYEITRHNVNNQFGDVNKRGISGVTEQLPEYSTNFPVSSSSDPSQVQRVEQLRPDIGTESHTSGALNLGYVSRWMKAPPGSPSHCEVSSSCESDSDDGHIGSHDEEMERQNQVSLQHAHPNSDLIVNGISEREKMIVCPRNSQVSSSCESDSDASGYSNLCLRVSEDSMEDETDHSSGKEKRNKSCETSLDTKDGDDAHINVRRRQFKSAESAKCYVCDEVPTQIPPVSPLIKKKRGVSHPGQMASYLQLDANKSSHRHQQWTGDFSYRERPARLRSQSPTDRRGRWRRSQSPVEPCRKLRSRSVLPIRDTHHATWRKRRSKSCDTYSKHKQSHESLQPSKVHALFKGVESISEAPSNNKGKRQSRSPRRRWSKSTCLPVRHKTSSISRNKSIPQVTSGNSESLSVGAAAKYYHSNNTHKHKEENTTPVSEHALVRRSCMNQLHPSKVQNVKGGELMSRTRRSLSRSRSIPNKAQQESTADSFPTKIKHNMSEVHVHSSEKEKALEGYEEHITKQAAFLNTPKKNIRISRKKDSLKDHMSTISSDSVIHNTPRIITRLNKLLQEDPGFGSKLSIQGSPSADSSKSRQLPSEQLSLKNMCSEAHDSSEKFLHSAPANAFKKNTCSRRSQVLSEEWFTSSSRHSAPVNTSRRQSRSKKFQETKEQSTISNTHGILMKSTEEVCLSKSKKLSDHVVESSSSMTRRDGRRYDRPKAGQELEEDTLSLERFLGFPEEEVVLLNSSLSRRRIRSESCGSPISIETVNQVHRTIKGRRFVLTHDPLLSVYQDEMASEFHSSSGNKRLCHSSSRKRKLSNKVCQSHDKPLTSRTSLSSLSGSCENETVLHTPEGRPMEKYPSHNTHSSLRITSEACENQGEHQKRNFKQSAEVAYCTPQSKQAKVSKEKSHHQTVACNLHPQLGHYSAVNESAATNENPHPPSKEERYIKNSETDGSLFKDASPVQDAVVKCSSQERICHKGTSKSLVKPCSVVLKNLVLSSVFDKSVNKSEKFVFPSFPHVASVTKVREFCLPRDYTHAARKKRQVN